MPSVFLSHSSRDKPFVCKLADSLKQDPRITVWLDELEIDPGSNIVSEIAEGLDSDFILLILSPDSVKSAWVKEEWTDAFWEQTNDRRAKLAGVLYRECRIPRLLGNKKYFDLRTNHPEGFRAIRTWLLTEKPAQPTRSHLLPTRPPLFIGREAELSNLRERLKQPGAVVPLFGMPGRGKTTLALEFAHRYYNDFESLYWLPCQSRDIVVFTADLQRQLDLKIEGGINEVVAELKNVLARKRCLLILDNLDEESASRLIPGGSCSVLILPVSETCASSGFTVLSRPAALHRGSVLRSIQPGLRRGGSLTPRRRLPQVVRAPRIFTDRSQRRSRLDSE